MPVSIPVLKFLIWIEEETVKSCEAGIKSEWFDHKLRFNLTGFIANYKRLQSPQIGSNLTPPYPGLVVSAVYDLDAKGVEMELAAAPFHGLTLNGGLGYTSWKTSNINPLNINNHEVINIPHWTGNTSALYQTDPLFGTARLVFSLNGSWRSRERVDGYSIPLPAEFRAQQFSRAGWILNGRIALKDVQMAHGGNVELALWAKNITNSDRIAYLIDFNAFQSAIYEAARTYGFDASFHF